jgi:hypothetical protein
MKNSTPRNSFIQAFHQPGSHFSPQHTDIRIWESLKFPFRLFPVLERFAI